MGSFLYTDTTKFIILDSNSIPIEGATIVISRSNSENTPLTTDVNGVAIYSKSIQLEWDGLEPSSANLAIHNKTDELYEFIVAEGERMAEVDLTIEPTTIEVEVPVYYDESFDVSMEIVQEEIIEV